MLNDRRLQFIKIFHIHLQLYMIDSIIKETILLFNHSQQHPSRKYHLLGTMLFYIHIEKHVDTLNKFFIRCLLIGSLNLILRYSCWLSDKDKV